MTLSTAREAMALREELAEFAREIGCTCADAAMLREFVRERDRQEEAC